MTLRAACAIACAWGFAEATLFFIVPDVWLTFLVMIGLRPALLAASWAIAGGLAGGITMLWLGAHDPATAARLLDAVPAISPALIARVHAGIEQHGLLAVLLGPIGGVPYKIYAVEWGARHGSWLVFTLVSVPARGVRFFLAPVLVALIRRGIAPLTRGRRAVEAGVLAGFWVAFYTFYFLQFPG